VPRATQNHGQECSWCFCLYHPPPGNSSYVHQQGDGQIVVYVYNRTFHSNKDTWKKHAHILLLHPASGMYLTHITGSVKGRSWQSAHCGILFTGNVTTQLQGRAHPHTWWLLCSWGVTGGSDREGCSHCVSWSGAIPRVCHCILYTCISMCLHHKKGFFTAKYI